MRKFRLIYIAIFVCLVGCAHQKSEPMHQRKIVANESMLQFVDQTGKYFLKRVSGMTADGKIAVKQELLDESKKIVLEQSISISTPGRIKNISMLRPEKSEYSVWFDKIKHKTSLTLEKTDKAIKVEIESPDKTEQGEKLVEFPTGEGLFCYYTQLVECATYSGFIKKSIELHAGKMNFYIIWDGYPFISQQYPTLPNELFTEVSLEYDGQYGKTDYRYVLSINDQEIIYIVSSEGIFKKLFWIVQGVSIHPLEDDSELQKGDSNGRR